MALHLYWFNYLGCWQTSALSSEVMYAITLSLAKSSYGSGNFQAVRIIVSHGWISQSLVYNFGFWVRENESGDENIPMTDTASKF